jgi:predicted metallopeptidase
MKIDNLTEVIQKMQEKIDSLENSNRKEVIKKLDHVTEQVDANLRKHGSCLVN